MTLARLLTAALVLCSLPALAQGDPKGGPVLHDGRFFGLPCLCSATTSAEPWRIIPNRHVDLRSGPDLLEHIRDARMRSDSRRPVCPELVFEDFFTPAMGVAGLSATIRIPKDAVLNSQSDTTCYTIRSYVVARDSKDSDSTHPAGYSTCRPSNRYQVRSAEMRVDSGDR